MEPNVTDTNQSRDAEQKLQASRLEAVQKIQRNTKALLFAGGAASLGCMLVKQRNGLTIGENVLRRMLSESEQVTPEKYLKIVIGDSTGNAGRLKRLGGNAVGSGSIFLLISGAISLGGYLAEKLSLRSPER